MLGGRNRQSKQPLVGYTIVEVMIVLAVSGIMFLVAANFINGKQAKAAFTEGTNDMASQIQDVIEQVTAGQFSDIPLNCTFDGSATDVSGNTAVHSNGTDSNEGINSQCVFLGKILRFYSSTDATTYRIISLAAGRVTQDPVTQEAVTPTLQNTHPAVIVDLTKPQTIPQSLTVKSVTVTDVDGSSHTANYNFGFAEGLGAVAGGSFQSGAQTITMIYSPAAAPVHDGGVAEDDTDINNNFSYAKSAVMCMTDGSRYAELLIGGANGDTSQLSVIVQVVPTC